MSEQPDADSEGPADETVVEWDAPVGGPQSVRVDPYAATITVNGRVFETTKLCSEDVPDWLYRSADTSGQQPDESDRDE